MTKILIRSNLWWAWALFIVGFIASWLANLWQLIESVEPVGVLIVRGIGVIVPPLGAVMGLF